MPQSGLPGDSGSTIEPLVAASGTNASLAYAREGTPGQQSANPFKQLRSTGRNINLKKEALESQEVSLTRQRADVRHGFNRVEGTIPFELSRSTYDDFLAWAFGREETAGSTGWFTPSTAPASQEYQIAALLGGTACTVTRTVATGGTFDFVNAGYRPGDYVTTSGFLTANNGLFRVVAVSALVLTLIADGQTTFVNDTTSIATGTITYRGAKLRLGTNLITFTLERRFADFDAAGTDIYNAFIGCAINTMKLSSDPTGLVGGDFGIIGERGVLLNTAAIDATIDPAPSNSPFAAQDAQVFLNSGAGLSQSITLTNFEMNLDNQRTLQPVIGSKFSPDVYEGVAKVTGTLTALLADNTLLAYYANETSPSQLTIRWNELGTGQFMSLSLYRIKVLGDDIDPPQNGAVLQQCNFEALEQSFSTNVTYKEVLHLQRSV